MQGYYFSTGPSKRVEGAREGECVTFQKDWLVPLQAARGERGSEKERETQGS